MSTSMYLMKVNILKTTGVGVTKKIDKYKIHRYILNNIHWY